MKKTDTFIVGILCGGFTFGLFIHLFLGGLNPIFIFSLYLILLLLSIAIAKIVYSDFEFRVSEERLHKSQLFAVNQALIKKLEQLTSEEEVDDLITKTLLDKINKSG